jgi:DNA polymerase alpha subunit A
MSQISDEGDVYEEVSEEEYRELVESRRKDADFVVDDDGTYGYADDGEDNWEDYDDYYDERMDEAEIEARKRERDENAPARKRKRLMEKARRISSTFLKDVDASVPLTGSAISRKSKRPQEFPTDQLNSLLGDLVSNPTSEPVLDLSAEIRKKARKETTEDIALFGQSMQVSRAQTEMESERMMAKPEFGFHSGAMDLDEVIPVYHDYESPPKKLKLEDTKPENRIMSVQTMNEEELSTSVQNFQAMDANKLSGQTTVKTDGMGEMLHSFSANFFFAAEGALQMFWTDAYEDIHNAPGTIFLIGKVRCNDGNDFTSCCIQVRNNCRNVYFLPRATNLESKFPLVDVNFTYLLSSWRTCRNSASLP